MTESRDHKIFRTRFVLSQPVSLMSRPRHAGRWALRSFIGDEAFYVEKLHPDANAVILKRPRVDDPEFEMEIKVDPKKDDFFYPSLKSAILNYKKAVQGIAIEKEENLATYDNQFGSW